MAATLFISYSRADMQETDWLARLRMYLTPFRRSGEIDVWDDSRIATGTLWKEEIARALHSASAAVLLVGPGFLASDFVMKIELPALLNSAKVRGVALFPLIVGFSGYDATILHQYEAYNSPEQPLESLTRSDQNRILNALAIAIDKSLRSGASSRGKPRSSAQDLHEPMREIQRYRTDALTAFVAQCRRRDDLVAAIEKRLNFKNDLEYEKFFFRYHSLLNEEERFEFNLIRAMTEGSLQPSNRKILEIIETHPAMLEVLPEMTALRQHLVFWLNKYEQVFLVNKAMCVLYTGVEDGVPFPDGFDTAIATWLRTHTRSTS
jgi:hypothetical protein